MKVKNKKSVLIAIIILLAITLPLGITGMVVKLQDKETPTKKPETPIPVVENPNHEFHYQGKLYFYDDDNLLGTYECDNKDGYCDYAKTTYDDENYPILSYKEEEPSKISLVANRYAFIIDAPSENEASEVILYDLQNQRRVAKYNAVKNYGIGIENNEFIVKSTLNKWGVITLNENGNSVSIPFDYDFIGLTNDQKENVIASEKYIVAKDNLWSIIGSDQSTYATDFKEMIVTYNGKHIITKVDNLYYAKTYEGTNVLAGCNNLTFTGKFFNITDQNNKFYVYNSDTGQIISKDYQVNATDTITSKIEGQTLQIILNDKVIETINI